MKIELEDLINVVSSFFETTPEQMFEKTRIREVVETRMFYFVLSKKYTGKTLREIGEIATNYGRQRVLDHATVLHGIKTINDLCYSEPKYVDILNRLISRVNLELLNQGLLKELVPREVNLLAMCKSFKKSA